MRINQIIANGNISLTISSYLIEHFFPSGATSNKWGPDLFVNINSSWYTDSVRVLGSSSSYDLVYFPGSSTYCDAVDVSASNSSSVLYHQNLFQSSSNGQSCSGLGFPSSSCHKSKKCLKPCLYLDRPLLSAVSCLQNNSSFLFRNKSLRTSCHDPSNYCLA